MPSPAQAMPQKKNMSSWVLPNPMLSNASSIVYFLGSCEEAPNAADRTTSLLSPSKRVVSKAALEATGFMADRLLAWCSPVLA